MAYTLTEKQKDLLTRYAKGEAKPRERAGTFRVEGDDMVYRGVDQGKPISELLATFIPNGVAKYPVMNAARLEYANGHVAWGYRQRGRGPRACQIVLQDAGAIPIPFNILEEAGIKPRDIHIVHKAPSEMIVRMRTDEGHYGKNGWVASRTYESSEHFVGACVFEATDKAGQTATYLFDIDREEIKHKIFNPFIVKLLNAVTTVEEAYASLVPASVAAAIDEGAAVIRQGEWFFVPSGTPPTMSKTVELRAIKAPCKRDYGLPIASDYKGTPEPDGAACDYAAKDNPHLADNITRYNAARDAWIKAPEELELQEPHTGTLQAGNNRGNRVEETVTRNGVVYVRGTVSHNGREHRDVTLKDWHIAIPNTAITSWQVTGEID